MDNREDRKLFTDLALPDAVEMHEALSRVGFRRSQSVAYRPACENCNKCKSVRVLAQEFAPNKSMRRIINQNKDLKVEATDAFATPEQYELLREYLIGRHSEGGMAEMDEFEYAEMVELSPVNTSVVEYRKPTGDAYNLMPGRLSGAVLTDVMSDGLSMVYSFFDINSARPSLGTYMILDHIKRTQDSGLPHVYLGYWVEASPKMAYKTRFKPFQTLTGEGWV